MCCEITAGSLTRFATKSSCSFPHLLSNLMLSLYARHAFSNDVLVGTCGIPLEPQHGVSLQVVFEPSPLILLAELPTCRHRCRPFPGRRQSESTSNPQFGDLVGGRFIFLDDRSRQPLHLDTDRSRLYLKTLNG